MAEALAKVLGMDAVYGCGPENRSGILSGSERGWSVPRRKGKVPIVQQDADENGHDLTQCFGYGNTMADTWFMQITGNPIAVNPGSKMTNMANKYGWEIKSWKI
jgi:phosphoserine phosphatase